MRVCRCIRFGDGDDDGSGDGNDDGESEIRGSDGVNGSWVEWKILRPRWWRRSYRSRRCDGKCGEGNRASGFQIRGRRALVGFSHGSVLCSGQVRDRGRGESRRRSSLGESSCRGSKSRGLGFVGFRSFLYVNCELSIDLGTIRWWNGMFYQIS